jgi:hypothetical protein
MFSGVREAKKITFEVSLSDEKRFGGILRRNYRLQYAHRPNKDSANFLLKGSVQQD